MEKEWKNTTEQGVKGENVKGARSEDPPPNKTSNWGPFPFTIALKYNCTCRLLSAPVLKREGEEEEEEEEEEL